jgi:hypothetical protein
MKQAALGFRVHSGWTSLVAISLDGNLPVVLARQRPHLVETFSYTFRQPYHTAEKMPLGDARAFIARVRDEARRLAAQAIRAAEAGAKQQGYQINRCALLLASGRELPQLEKILAAHALIHTADGELFRQALLHAAAKCKMKMTALRERELLTRASSALNIRAPILLQRIANLGKTVGPPWSQDEKFAALAACVALKS